MASNLMGTSGHHQKTNTVCDFSQIVEMEQAKKIAGGVGEEHNQVQVYHNTEKMPVERRSLS